jgi:sodium-dependent dicarboxylate transporter 2/3/5
VAVLIDRRPLWRILLQRLRRPAAFALLAVLLVWFMGASPPAGLSVEGHRALGVFGVCLVLWMTGALPVGVTGLLAVALIALFGILDRGKVFALFGNEAMFFFLCAFILAAAVLRSGLSARVALLFLRRFGRSPRRLVLGIYVTTVLLSFFMVAQAVAAMLFPILVEILRALRLTPGQSRYGRALCLSLAWGAAIGSSTTLLGGSRIPLALQIVQETTRASIDFVDYFLAALPFVVALGLLGYACLVLFYAPEIDDVAPAARALEQRNQEIGKVGFDELLVAAVVVATVACWMLLGERVGLGTVGILAVVVLFVLRLVRWQDVEGYVNWGIILMYGGAICLGAALYATGAARWIAEEVVGSWASTALLVLFGFAILTKLLTEAMNNAGVVAVLLPLGLGIAAERGWDPRAMAFTVAILSGFSFFMPASSPQMALAYSPGFLRMRDVVVPGLLLSGATVGIFYLVARFYWPLLGLEILG